MPRGAAFFAIPVSVLTCTGLNASKSEVSRALRPSCGSATAAVYDNEPDGVRSMPNTH